MQWTWFVKKRMLWMGFHESFALEKAQKPKTKNNAQNISVWITKKFRWTFVYWKRALRVNDVHEEVLSREAGVRASFFPWRSIFICLNAVVDTIMKTHGKGLMNKKDKQSLEDGLLCQHSLMISTMFSWHLSTRGRRSPFWTAFINSAFFPEVG